MNQKLEDLELRSEEVQEILTKVPHWMIRWGNILFFLLILMVIMISWFIKYPDIITGQAIITTNVPPQKEYAKSSGKLTHLLVENNELVSTGTTLAILENTAKYKDVFYLKNILDTIKVNTEKFEFPIEDIPILFLGDIETDFALFENSYIQYKLNKELNPYQYQSTINNTSVKELSFRLETLLSQQSIFKSELLFKKKDLQRYKALYKKGVVSAQEYEKKQLNFLHDERTYQSISASISRVREKINTATNNNNSSIVNNTREEIKLLKNVIQSFNQLKKSVEQWELQYTFQSKIEGEVSFMNFWSENQTVSINDLVFTIIPKNHKYFVVKSKIPSLNSGKIKVGQKTTIKLENYPETEFGMLTGIVKSISSTTDSQGNYFVDIILPNKLTTTYNKELAFKHEMLCTVNIITEDLRLIERLFHQLKMTLKR